MEKNNLTPRAKGKMNKKERAMELFQYGYENSVIAVRVELSEEEVVKLRKEFWDRQK